MPVRLRQIEKLVRLNMKELPKLKARADVFLSAIFVCFYFNVMKENYIVI